MLTGWWIFLAISLSLPFLLTFVRRWLLAPIRIHRTQTIAAHPQLIETRLDQLTPEVQEYLGRVVQQLTAQDFQVVANATMPDFVPSAVGIQILMVNRSTNDMAAMMVAVTKLTRNAVTTIASRFADGTRITTQNNRNITHLPPDPAASAANFPWARDAALLLQAHRRRLQRAGRDRERRVAPAPGQELAFLQSEREREVARHVACGYRYLDERGDLYRVTWKGAFLSAWKISQPIKRWRIARRDRRARRLWEDLGMDAAALPQTFPAIAPAPAGSAPSVAVELPPILPDLMPQRAGGLAYQSRLAPGELRVENGPGMAIVRLCTPTAAQILLRQWVTLLFMLFVTFLLASSLYRMWLTWRFYSTVRYLPPTFPRPRLFQPIILLLAGLLAYESWQLWRALTRARGTSTVEATSHGLRFSNAPGRNRDGQIARDEIEQLQVRIDAPRISRPLYRLQAQRRGAGTIQILLVSPDKAAIVTAREVLLQAMGIDLCPIRH